MTDDDVIRPPDAEWERFETIDGGTFRLLFFPLFRVGFEHPCLDDKVASCDLRVGYEDGHELTWNGDSEITVTPSIKCEACGLAGTIIDATWSAA